MNPALTHIALHVSNFLECSAFYERYCGMTICHERHYEHSNVAWLAEPGKEREFIIVMIDGGHPRDQAEDDYSHLGFAVESAEAVDRIAERAKSDGCLRWPPRSEPYPVGYYCGVQDPGGNIVEFSFGQPLGPGAEE